MMRTVPFVLAALVAIAPAGGLSAAPSASSNGFIKAFDSWNAFADTENGKPRCYMASLPEKSAGDYSQRGDTYVIITHRPAENTVGEVSVRAGYTYKEGSEVEARVDSNQPFKLFTDGGYAWNRDSEGDHAMVAAMKAGITLIVVGTSSRGTLTTDTYSLKGFTAAYAAISKACGVK